VADRGQVVLTLVSDRRRTPDGDLPGLAHRMALAGVDWIQVREKDLGGRALRALVGEVVSATVGTPARVLVNGRPDVAEVAGAAGVQLPEDGLPVAEVRRSFPGLVVGASRHGRDGARRAEEEGADFVLLGPVFATPGKEGRALGLDVLAEVCGSVRVPVYAIGGIGPSTAARALEVGAAGLAAIRAFLERPPAEAVRLLRGAP
jgi:thiamine-phosphate pyrophosphorylase